MTEMNLGSLNNSRDVILTHARFRGARNALGNVLKRQVRESYWREQS
jgi:hypothetical protein